MTSCVATALYAGSEFLTVSVLAGGDAGDRIVPLRGNLPGPSRRVVVEPIEIPAEPTTVPDKAPAEPAVRPDGEPVPSR